MQCWWWREHREGASVWISCLPSWGTRQTESRALKAESRQSYQICSKTTHSLVTVWLAAWSLCVCVCGRGAREVGGVLGTRAGMTGCSCDMLQVTSAYACDKEDGRGGHIWTHSWLMQLRVWPSTHTHTHTESWNKRHKRESLHLSSPNFDAWWDWVSYTNNRFKSNGSALPSQK